MVDIFTVLKYYVVPKINNLKGGMMDPSVFIVYDSPPFSEWTDAYRKWVENRSSTELVLRGRFANTKKVGLSDYDEQIVLTKITGLPGHPDPKKSYVTGQTGSGQYVYGVIGTATGEGEMHLSSNPISPYIPT